MLEVNRLSAAKLGLSGVASNAAEASRTCEINVEHAESITFVYSLSWVAATAMTAQFYLSPDDKTTYGRVMSVAVSAGAGVSSDYSWSHDVTASDAVAITVDCRNATHIKGIFAATGGGATDLITVVAGSGEPG